MYKRVIFGEIANDNVAELKDINSREKFILAVLATTVLLFGIWPAPVFDIMHPSIKNLFEHIIQSKVG
jgi:NADH-quinone oxidoreductase subunit M